MSVLYSELVIDGVLGDIYDKDAIHELDLAEKLSEQLTVGSNLMNVFLEMLYPVGSVYIGPDPSNFIGGQWTRRSDVMIVGAGNRYSVGATGGSADAVAVTHTHQITGSTNSAGAHTHVVTGTAASAGAHQHTAGSGWYYSIYKGSRSTEKVGAISGTGFEMTQVSSSGSWSGIAKTVSAGAHIHSISASAASSGTHNHTISISCSSGGVDGTDKNMPPYRAYEIWERIA